MRLKSKFESLRKEGRFSEPISRAAELHIISTLKLGGLYESFTPIFDKHVETRFPLPLYYS